MKKILYLILAIFIYTLSTISCSARHFNDIIITSPNGIWTDSRTYSSLQDAITAVGSSDREIVIVNEHSVTNLTVPSNVRLRFLRDGSINNSGQLTINTTNISADDIQIFTGVGDIDFASGSVIRSSWFADVVDAFDLTSDDTITLVIPESYTILENVAVGNNVCLKWEAPNIITISSGFTLSNINNIEAGNYQIFSGAGDFDFVDGTRLKSSWFIRLRSLITYVGDAKVEVEISKNEIIDFDTTSPENIALEVTRGGMVSPDLGVTFTINGYFKSGIYQSIGEDGTVTLGSNATKISYPRWWGIEGHPQLTDILNMNTHRIVNVVNPINPQDAATKTSIDAKISDSIYGGSWNGITGISPSKNAVYDKFGLIETSISDAIALILWTDHSTYIVPDHPIHANTNSAGTGSNCDWYSDDATFSLSSDGGALELEIVSTDTSGRQPLIWLERDFIGTAGSVELNPMCLYAQTKVTGSGENFLYNIMSIIKNDGTGDNDAVGIAGRASKGGEGPGDACGIWGSAYNKVNQDGGVMGMEASIYQNVAGMVAGDRLMSKWSAALHVMGSSIGSPAKAGIAIDATNTYRFWNAMIIDKNCFAGAGTAGTVGINAGSWDAGQFPEYGIKLGRAHAHLYCNVESLCLQSDKSMLFHKSNNISENFVWRKGPYSGYTDLAWLDNEGNLEVLGTVTASCGVLSCGGGGGGGGNVTGPVSSTDRAIALWNGVGGDTLQDSPITIDSNGHLIVGDHQIRFDNAQNLIWRNAADTDWVIGLHVSNLDDTHIGNDGHEVIIGENCSSNNPVLIRVGGVNNKVVTVAPASGGWRVLRVSDVGF